MGGSKGQWFLVSAVIATGAFLAFSVLFKDYFAVDVSRAVMVDEDYYFRSVKDGLQKTAAVSCPDNRAFRRNAAAFAEFTKERLAEKGYLLTIIAHGNDINSIACALNFHENFPLLLLQSDKAQVWEGERPEVEIA